jgi:trimethylguanosine synthase
MITTSDKAQHTENKYSDSTTIVLEMNQEVASTKKKKRVRRSQSCKAIIYGICFLGVCSCYSFRLHFYIIVSWFL